MTIKVYTDASYYWQKDIAACGYVVINGLDVLKHEVVIVEKIKNIDHAEFFSIYHALQVAFLVKDVSLVNIFSDSQQALKICRREGFFNRKGYAILLDDFFELLLLFKEHNIEVNFHKVKAHTEDHFNKMVDCSSRKQLRKYLKELS